MIDIIPYIHFEVREARQTELTVKNSNIVAPFVL